MNTPVPFFKERPFFPEILDTIIDLFRYSKEDLLALALVGRNWNPRARFCLVHQHLSDLHLDSLKTLTALAQLSSSPLCTILRPTFQSITIPAFTESSGINQPNDVFSFIDKVTVTQSITINLGFSGLKNASCSFPWRALASWTTLTSLCLSGSLPSITTLASVLLELPELEIIEVDVDYLDCSTPTCAGYLSQHLRSLSLGPRGYGFLDWLASLEASVLCIQTLVLKIDCDRMSPLQAFSCRHGDSIEYFTATFYQSRAQDLAPCLGTLPEVHEIELYFNYTASPMGYFPCIWTLSSCITSSSVQMLNFYTPPLPGGELEALRLSLLAKHSMNAADDKEDPCSVSVCQRSWMVVR